MFLLKVFMSCSLVLAVYGNFLPVAPVTLSFSYSGPSGPQNWGDVSPACKAKNQSPIDILWTKIPFSDSGSEFKINGDTQTPKSIEVRNNGNGATFEFKFAEKYKPNITGGPLGDKKYNLHSFQLHWGGEHTFNGVSFAAEIEILHINSKYETLAQASAKKDGLAVLSFVYNSIPQEAIFTNLPFLDLFAKVTEPKSKYSETKAVFTYRDIISKEDSNIASYVGSLTYPPCTGNVTYLVAETQLWINEQELKALKTIKGSDKNPVLKNNRPVQNADGRKPIIYLPKSE